MTSPSSPLPDLLREQDGRHPFWLRVVFLGAALVCLVLGVVGWLIPVITGIPFYAAGLVFLGLASDRDRKSTRLNSSHMVQSRMPSSA